MPKPILNNRITYNSIAGIIIQHDDFLDQEVRVTSSPTFANMLITGDSTINGNLWVKGNTTILDTNVIEFEDNIVLINRRETGSGVTLNQSGFEIERGSLENYRMVYNESDQTYRVGVISNLQAVATRQDNPLPSGIMTWNDASKRLDSVDTISVDITFTGTTDSTSCTTGVLKTSGGVGVKKSVFVGGKLSLVGSGNSASEIWTNSTTDSLNITSTREINLTPGLNVRLPFDKQIALGTTEQSIAADSVTKDINVTGSGHVNFYLAYGKAINIPNQTPLTFSTQNEKIYTDSANNMIMAARQDIMLNPGSNRKVLLPLDIPISFSNEFQRISANLNNDLLIGAGNHIYLSPGPNLDVRIPTDNALKLGGSGNQKIYSDSDNNLYIGATVSIRLNSQKVQVPYEVPVTFGADSQSIRSATTGALLLSSSSTVITSTNEADSGSTASLVVLGGIGVQKKLYTEGGVVIDSNSSEALFVQKRNGGYGVLVIDNARHGEARINAGDGSRDQAALEIVNATNGTSAPSLIQLKALHDQSAGYTIGRGSMGVNSGRILNVNVPNYSDYNNTGNKPKFMVTSNNGSLELMSVESETGNVGIRGDVSMNSTTDAVNASTASLSLSGGLGVRRGIHTNGKVTIVTDSTSGLLVTNSSGASLFAVDTINRASTLGTNFYIEDKFAANIYTNVLTNSMVNVITNTAESVDTSTASLVVSGGVSVQKNLRISGQTDLYSRLHMHDQPITNVKDPVNLQDVATKAYVDLAALRGLYAKESVQVATTTHGNLSTAYNPGAVIDGYTLREYDRILIKNQIDESENGMYIVYSSGAPQRSMDLIVGDHAVGIFTFIQFGILQASTGWICNSAEGNDVVGTHNLSFVQFSGLGKVTAGAGLSKNFNEIFVNVDNSSIEIVDDALRVKGDIAGTGLTGGSGAALETLSDQSHVTKLGTIETGVWKGTAVGIEYGGTGREYFSSGSVLYGNGTSGLRTTTGLTFDDVSKDLHISNGGGNASVYIESTSGNPQLVMAQDGLIRGVVGVTDDFGEYGNDTYPKSLVIKNQDNTTCSNVQIVTQTRTRMTISHNGNVGINTSNPVSMLAVNGTMSVYDTATFENTANSTNVSNGSFVVRGGASVSKDMHVGGKVVIYDTSPSTTTNNGSVVIHGGLSIRGNQNAVNIGNGGGLTVAGGASIGGDLFIGGQINGSGNSSSTFAYLTITATDEAINLTSGSIITFGGLTIQAMTNAASVTDGGALLVAGGASVGGDFYVGGNQRNYGQVFYSGTDNAIMFCNVDDVVQYSIKKTNDDFAISRYNTSGNLINDILRTNAETGQTTFYNTAASTSLSSASLVAMGGISINSTDDATSVTCGGGITNIGGQSVGKRLLVGGDTILYSTTASQSNTSGALVIGGGVGVGGSLNITEKFSIQRGNMLLDSIDNNLDAAWYYMGNVTLSYLDIELSNSVNSSTDNYSVRMIANISTSTATFSHSHIGNMDIIHGDKVNLYVFKNTAENSYHLFAHVPAHSVTNVFVRTKTNDAIKIVFEGTLLNPNGVTSGYTGGWTESYTTAKESTLHLDIGNLVSRGDTFSVSDNFPVIGHNNSNTTGTRDLGVLYQRYQLSNDVGRGDVVSESAAFVDSLPNQSTSNDTQIKFSNLASAVDNYYNGWWIRVMTGANVDQIRRIIGYNGSQRIAQVDVPWTTQNPAAGDTVNLYNLGYVTNYFDEQDKMFKMSYAALDPENSTLVSTKLCDLQTARILVDDTTPSSSAMTGSIHTFGGISIENTTDSVSCTRGGSLTTLGGMGISKRLFVGDNIVIGRNLVTPQSALHINHTSASLTLQSDRESFAYIDFVETGTSKRFGLLSNMLTSSFALTFNNSGTDPNNATKLITVQSTGNMGISTTNVNNLLVLAQNNFISADNDTGYIGILGGNTSGSKIVLHGNNHVSNAGDIILQTGCSSSSLQVHTNTSGNAVMTIENSGKVIVSCTNVSSNVSSGSLVVNGGIAIATTKNASSIDNGGCLTVAGGASIKRDTYIGGDLYLLGSLIATGEPISPNVTFSNTQGCSITLYSNNKLMVVGTEAIFTMSIEVMPVAGSETCQFEFTIPGRSENFATRGDMIGTCSGYTDEQDIIAIFNTLCVGVTGTTKALVKFQSVNTGLHSLTVMCRYTL